MAINYSYKEIVHILWRNENLEEVQDVLKRYPLASRDAVHMLALAGTKFVDFAFTIPEHVSASKVNKECINQYVVEDSEELKEEKVKAEVEEPEAKEVEEKPEPKKAAEPAKRRGRPPKKAAEPAKPAPKPKTVEEVMDEALDDNLEDDFEDGVTDEYSGKSAIELFKMCKARGMKVPAKQAVEFYASKLREDDLKQEDDADDDDDWDI